MTLTILSVIPVLIWIHLFFGRGRFWLIRSHFPPLNASATPNSRIAAIIPARDEALSIGEAVNSLLRQRIPKPIQIFVIDDGSTDGTGQVAEMAASRLGISGQLNVLKGQPVPPGWTGKLWAVSQGIEEAKKLAPDYFLLTDADISHSSQSISRLVTIAGANRCDLASYMVKLATESTAEKLLIPAFVYFFLQLYPPRWIFSPNARTAGAAGGCLLIRPETLEKIGGIAAIRNQVIDDCALAKAVKRSGGTVWMGLTNESRSTRSYGGFSAVGRMISRSAYNQLHHSSILLAATLIGLFLTYVLPPLLFLTGRPVALALGAFAWSLMAVSYIPMLRFYRQSAVMSLLLPLVAVFYAGATVHSAWRYWRGRGGEWKGRIQDVRAHEGPHLRP